MDVHPTKNCIYRYWPIPKSCFKCIELITLNCVSMYPGKDHFPRRSLTMFDHCLTPSAWWCRHPQYVWPPGRGCPAGTSGCPSCPPPCQCPRPHGRTWGRPRRKSPETRPRPRTSRHGPQGQWWIPLWFLRCRMVSTPFKGKTWGQNYQRKMRKWKGAVLSMGNLDISTPTYKYFVHSGTFDPKKIMHRKKTRGLTEWWSL